MITQRIPLRFAVGLCLLSFYMMTGNTAVDFESVDAAEKTEGKGLAPRARVAAVRPIDFNRDIRPVLSDKCFACHGPDATHREGKLRLDVEKDALASKVIVPGMPQKSVLIERITSGEESARMPPADSGKSLKAEEIEILRRWIAEGAKWAPHWAYVAPKKHVVPTWDGKAASSNWIDDFLLDRWRRERIKPAKEADRRTLLRRLSFDLTGLPPTPDEVDRFLADPDPRAYEKVVDRLLASEHFGEWMAVYWLDLVRFADTVGYHGDQDHHSTPYRDYVIDAFNHNLPFDRFTREQLAGDLLNDSDRLAAKSSGKPLDPGLETDRLIASCYNRLLQTSHEGGVQEKEYLTIYAADRVRNVSAVWMGGTLGCAQCHDHKFDPYTSRDFYAMAAFFADVDEAHHLRHGTNNLPTERFPEAVVHTRRERERLAELDRSICELEVNDPAKNSSKVAGTAKNKRERLASLIAERDALKKAARRVMITKAIAPRVVRVLPRGSWLDDSGAIVAPAVPTFLGSVAGPNSAVSRGSVTDLTTSSKGRATRLDLANWLTDTKNGVGGLTSRVFVNRMWYLFFGGGLSKSLEDFGGQGAPPDHPELLDNLAIEFVEQGWNVKALIRLIVTSRAYRQSSLVTDELRERDPDNRLFARQGRWRLPAEAIRDNALFVSRLLVLDIGGGSVKPYQPAGYYRHLNFPQRKYVAHTDARQWRRGVYVHWQRQYLHPMLKAFDAPTREECTPQRPRSNTPLAALVLLNDPTFVEAARGLAQRVLMEGGSTEVERLKFAFRQTTCRDPDATELAVLVRLLKQARHQEPIAEKLGTDIQTMATGIKPFATLSKRGNRGRQEKPAAILEIGLSPRPKSLDVGELKTWMSVCRALLNLSETNTRE